MSSVTSDTHSDRTPLTTTTNSAITSPARVLPLTRDIGIGPDGDEDDHHHHDQHHHDHHGHHHHHIGPLRTMSASSGFHHAPVIIATSRTIKHSHSNDPNLGRSGVHASLLGDHHHHHHSHEHARGNGKYGSNGGGVVKTRVRRQPTSSFLGSSDPADNVVPLRLRRIGGTVQTENDAGDDNVFQDVEFNDSSVFPAEFTSGDDSGDDGGDERILLNVGGVRHETHVSTLRTIPNSRLSRLAELHLDSGGGRHEYFFDRHPAVFNSIIDFYRTGELHVPLEVCGAVVKRELDFWQICELEIKACCWRHYRSYIENQNILNSFNHSLKSQAVEVDLDELKGWKKLQWQVWMVLEFPRTSRLAMIYGVTSFLFVVTSIAGFCLETLPELKPKFLNVTMQCNGGQEMPRQVMSSHEALNTLDIICTIFFTLELLLRFTFAPEKLKFVRSLMNIIDLLALVPLYVTVIFTKSDNMQACYLTERFVIEIMFILRIFRMFRIFHLVKHYQALKVLVYAIKASIQELLMLFIFLLIGMLIFSTMIYYAERKDSTEGGDNFPTIPMGFWWSIITMTTVGYGDVYPTTAVGYVVGTACSVCGVLLVALTIPVISNNFTLFYRHVQSRTAIPKTQGGEEQDYDGCDRSDRDSGSGSWFGRKRFRRKKGSKESKGDDRRRGKKGYSRSGSQLDRLSGTSSRRSSTSVSNLVAYMNGHAGAGTRLIRGSSGRPPPIRRNISGRIKENAEAAADIEDLASGSTQNNSTSSNLKKSASDFTFNRGRAFRAYSDDGVMYKGESIV